MSRKAPEDYSTNPNTIKARRRRMDLGGARKIEDAARTADYKALCHARKLVEAKPEYLAASNNDKASMLESSMRDTMEKRRAKGQDTMSKLAALKVNEPRTPRVPPISRFLEDNGFAPARAGRQSQGHGSAAPSTNNRNYQIAVPSSAPYPDLGAPSTFHANGGNSIDTGPSSSNSNLFMSSHSSSSICDIKVSNTPAPFANMSQEPIESIEVDPNNDIAVLRNEVSTLHKMCQSILNSNNNLRQQKLQDMRAELVLDQSLVTNLVGRLDRLEGVVRTIQNVSVPSVVARVAALEGAVEKLTGKIGDGCEGEVTKMREAFGSLRGALARVGDFI